MPPSTTNAELTVVQFNRYARKGASTRLRSLQYLPSLERRGIRVATHPLFTDEILGRFYQGRSRGAISVGIAYLRRMLEVLRTHRCDCVWVEKELLPFLPSWGMRLLKSRRLPVLVDYDDATFHSYELHSNPIVRIILRNKIANVMRSAHVVTVGNDYLADYAMRAGAKRVEMIPTVVDLSQYIPRETVDPAGYRIGWIGTPNTSKYLGEVTPAIERLAKEHGAPITLVVIGAVDVRVNGVRLETHPWDERTEAAIIKSFDVGIMPLPDRPFERGKCGYKLIQYMACKVPVIATPIGVNARIVQDGRNGYLATTPSEWQEALRKLRDDPVLRARLGAAGRSLVEREYSLAITAPRLADILLSLASHRPCAA